MQVTPFTRSTVDERRHTYLQRPKPVALSARRISPAARACVYQLAVGRGDKRFSHNVVRASSQVSTGVVVVVSLV